MSSLTNKTRLRCDAKPLAAKPNAKGTGYDIKFFPVSFPAAKSSPYKIGQALPDIPAKKADWSKWVEYYTEIIGAYIELLNAIQWNAKKDWEVELATKLDEFGIKLKDDATDTTKLDWPLNNTYKFSPQSPKPNGRAPAVGECERCSLEVEFEAEREYALVVNCRFSLEMTWRDPVIDLSSSSSYIATSSSSSPTP